MNIENKIKHYWDCAGALKPETHVHKLLKSYYMGICRTFAQSSIQMPKEKFSRNTMCRRCSSKWNETDFRMKQNPQEITKSTKSWKQIEKLYNAKKDTEQRRALTRKQRKRAKWLQKRLRNSVEIQCGFCNHKTTVPMNKPSKKERDNEHSKTKDLNDQSTTEIVLSTPLTLKKKKRKNKDKTAGLKVEKIKKFKKTLKTAPNRSEKECDEKIKNNDKVNTTKTMTNSNQKCVKNSAEVVKLTANLSQILKTKKKKNKQASTPQMQSKTQQKNSLLQLAALLKAQTTNKSGSKSAQNRLETLLK